MPGLVPGIYVFLSKKVDVDGRDKPGHDRMMYSGIEAFQLFFTIGHTLFSSGIKASSAGMVAMSL
jgi:hypothetical protein